MSVSFPVLTSSYLSCTQAKRLPASTFFHFLFAYSQRHEVIVLMQRAIAKPPVCTRPLTHSTNGSVFFKPEKSTDGLQCLFVFFSPLCSFLRIWGQYWNSSANACLNSCLMPSLTNLHFFRIALTFMYRIARTESNRFKLNMAKYYLHVHKDYDFSQEMQSKRILIDRSWT